MARSATQQTVRQYVHVLRGFGLSPARIRTLHDMPTGEFDLETLEESVDFPTKGPTVSVTDLKRHLPNVLARSDVGIEAPRKYWNELPTMQLRAVIDTYGGSFAVCPENAQASRTQAPIRGSSTLQITDERSGSVRRTRFKYPDTALGDDNYPALLATINETILSETHLRFVQLTTREDRWRFALVDERRLETLTDTFGDRIEWQGTPVLHEYQPAAYDRNVTPDPPDADSIPSAILPDPEDTTSAPSLPHHSRTDFEELAAKSDAKEVPPDDSNAFDHGDSDATGPSVEELATAVDPSALVDGGNATVAASSTDGGVDTAPTGDIDELFATIDDTTLETSQSDAPGSAGTPTSAAGSAGTPTSAAESAGKSTDRSTPDGSAQIDVESIATTATVDWEIGDDVDRNATMAGTDMEVDRTSDIDANVDARASGGRFDADDPETAVDRDAPADAIDEVQALDDAFEELNRTATQLSAGEQRTTQDDDITSSDIIESLEHENASPDASTEAGFIWLDPDELTPVPEAVYDAANAPL